MPSSRHDVVQETVDSKTAGSQTVDSHAVDSRTGPAPSLAPEPGGDVVEYVVRPDDDSWRIEHAGGSYGPYKSRREATLFAIDAARKLAAAAKKNTRVRAVDQAGHLLTTWEHPAPAR